MVWLWQVWAYNGSCVTTPCSAYDTTTKANLKSTASNGGGVVNFVMLSSPYVGMVQGVNGTDGGQYFVVTKYKLTLASQLPCDRSYASACATANAVSLTGHMVSSLMVPPIPAMLPGAKGAATRH